MSDGHSLPSGSAPRATRYGEDQLRLWMLGGLDGDPACERALLRAVRAILEPFYRLRLRERSDVDDLVQETLLAVHERRSSYDRDRPFLPWLFAIARYKLADHFRRRRAHQPIEDHEHALASVSFQSSSDARLDVDRLLGALPAKQARAIRHTRLCGMSVAEAARAAGIGESDVKVSVHRGLRTLAARLSALETCGGDSLSLISRS